MAGGAIVICFRVNALALFMKVVPVKKDRAEATGKTIGDGDLVMARTFRLQCAKHGAASAHDVHRMSRAGDMLENGFERCRQSAQSAKFQFVFFELRLSG